MKTSGINFYRQKDSKKLDLSQVIIKLGAHDVLDDLLIELTRKDTLSIADEILIQCLLLKKIERAEIVLRPE